MPSRHGHAHDPSSQSRSHSMHKIEYSQICRVVDLVVAQGSCAHDCTCCLLGRISGNVLKMALGVGARICLNEMCEFNSECQANKITLLTVSMLPRTEMVMLMELPCMIRSWRSESKKPSVMREHELARKYESYSTHEAHALMPSTAPPWACPSWLQHWTPQKCYHGTLRGVGGLL